MITFRSSAVFTVSALILSACTQTSPEPTQITIDPVMTKYDSDGGGGGCLAGASKAPPAALKSACRTPIRKRPVSPGRAAVATPVAATQPAGVPEPSGPGASARATTPQRPALHRGRFRRCGTGPNRL